ncbi:IS4 family transposase [Niabella hirudinis]|uniref:IS4 family transposase n=1 Tax=Niabella hirudinis TaxID=1285929 RepID=UPI003EBE0CF0
MSKSNFFTGQPIFSQLLNLIPRHIVADVSQELKADRYCKKFTTYEHLVTFLFAVFNNCSSLREVTTGMLAWEQRIKHLGMKHFPRRSTFSDANQRRSEQVFEQIYLRLYNRFAPFLSDSRPGSKASRLYIFDSTTISLFQEVLKGSGLSKQDGRRKGGIKVHTLMRFDQDVPCMACFSPGAANDTRFLKKVQLPAGSTLVFDRGYRDYSVFNQLTADGITWVTRLPTLHSLQTTKQRPVELLQQQQGVLEDQEIVLGHNWSKPVPKVPCRLIDYKDPDSGKALRFITNNFKLEPATVAQYYKKRWQIEVLFKRLKQHCPLQYFLGDTENAIKIQIWCSLIADLLLKVIGKGARCKWSFSNLAAMVRLHLMTYLDIAQFLKSPEKALLNKIKNHGKTSQCNLFAPT